MVTVMVGTHKGAFVLQSDHRRQHWDVKGPYMKGVPVEYMTADRRDGVTLYASATNPFYGPKLYRSRDVGQTWDEIAAPKFTDGTRTVERVWVIEPGHSSQPGRLYAGVDPANLFVSDDRGESWTEVRSLTEHPTREQWAPGKGGMCLHTIIPDADDADKLFVAISAAGVFYSEDAGNTWSVRSKGVRADFLPNKHPDVGHCVHKICLHPQRKNVIFLQNHGGVYRSDDAGVTWQTIEDGLPAVFGFPIVIHPRHPETVYVIPLVADAERYTPSGRPAVYRSQDSGATWEELRRGLPEQSAWLNVLRQAMATDDQDEAGVYFGTSTGQLYCSANGGDQWALVTANLPPIYSVRTLTQ